jgi:uncharacterized repeat protein (TIGR02543 family)
MVTVSPTIFDAVKHSFEFGRLADGTYFYKVDGTDFPPGKVDIVEIANWVLGTIGKVTATIEGAIGTALPFTGYVGNIKIYINEVLKLDLPLTADFLDHSGNAYEITNVGVVLADPAGGSTYTVTYDGNGETGGTAPVDGSSPYNESDTVTVLGNTGSLVKTGHTFSKWNTASDGSGTDYDPADTFSMPASNVILYAQWTEDEYSLTYDANGGTGSVPTDSTTYNYGDTATVLGNTGSLVKTGYKFGGWNTAADGSGTTYVADDTVSIVANTTLYALYNKFYHVNDVVVHNHSTYWCKVSHTASAATEPGEGISWETYWGRGVNRKANVTLLNVTAKIEADTNFSVTSSGTGYTFSGDAGDLMSTAALFNAIEKIAVYLNGVYQEKGVNVTWQSATSFRLNSIVDSGDEITIIS